MSVQPNELAAAPRVRFFNERRKRVYPRLVGITALVWCATFLPYFWWRFYTEDRHFAGDFIVYWSAGKLVRQGHPGDIYDVGALYRLERATFPEIEGAFPWHYPPQYALIVLPLAFLPFVPALICWLGATGLAYAATLRAILPEWPAMALLLAIPAALANILFGQNGFLTASLIGAGLLLIDRRPGLAGGLFGLVTFKPHFVPVLVIALIAGKRWRALGGMAVGAALLAALSLLALGPGTWAAYLRDLDDASDYLTGKGATEKIPTVTGALLLAGFPSSVALAVQVVVSLGVAVVVWRTWSRHGGGAEARNAVTCAAILLATPYAFVYDLPIATLALCWLVAIRSDYPLSAAEVPVVTLMCLAPFLCWGVALLVPIQLGPLLLGALLVVSIRRVIPKIDAQSSNRQSRIEEAAVPAG